MFMNGTYTVNCISRRNAIGAEQVMQAPYRGSQMKRQVVMTQLTPKEHQQGGGIRDFNKRRQQQDGAYF